MNINEKVAYIKGLMDGLKLNESDDTVKLIKNVVDVLEDIADEVTDLGELYDELSEQVDDLTYKGTLKATAFYKSSKWDSKRYKFVDVPDSTKLYRTVIIKFRDKKYDYYTISIQADE